MLESYHTNTINIFAVFAFIFAFPQEASANSLRFCNVGELSLSYRKIALSTESFGRYPAKSISPNSCGPVIQGFPTTFAFFHTDEKGREYNLVYRHSGGPNIIERDHHLKIPFACFDPDRLEIEFVPRAYGETAWLTSDCPDGQLAAKTTITVSGIRGSGRIDFNLSVPEALPLSVWYDGKKAVPKITHSDALGAANPAKILFSGVNKAASITIDKISIKDVGTPMKYSDGSSPNLSASIDGTRYDADGLLAIYAKLIQFQVNDATTRRLNHIYLSPEFIQTDNGGHVLIYPDLRRSEVILGPLSPGSLYVDEDSEYFESILKDLAAASFFADSLTVLGYPHSVAQYVDRVGAGWTPSSVTQFMEN